MAVSRLGKTEKLLLNLMLYLEGWKKEFSNGHVLLKNDIDKAIGKIITRKYESKLKYTGINIKYIKRRINLRHKLLNNVNVKYFINLKGKSKIKKVCVYRSLKRLEKKGFITRYKNKRFYPELTLKGREKVFELKNKKS